jgi:hypothetical protein
MGTAGAGRSGKRAWSCQKVTSLVDAARTRATPSQPPCRRTRRARQRARQGPLRSPISPAPSCPSNTGDKLRRARTRRAPHGWQPCRGERPHQAPPHRGPPFVSFIASFGRMASSFRFRPRRLKAPRACRPTARRCSRHRAPSLVRSTSGHGQYTRGLSPSPFGAARRRRAGNPSRPAVAPTPLESQHPRQAGRTRRLSCEAVAAVPRRRGHGAAPCPALPGAAPSFVSFKRLFDGPSPFAVPFA